MKFKAFIGKLFSITLVTVSLSSFASEPIQPIERPADIDQSKAALGMKLFFDPRLSKSGFLSCNSCHNLSMGGSDNLKTSIGHNWQQGPINSPTVLNAGLSLAQFWDGRAATLKEQAGGPIANPVEMASSHKLVADVLKTIPQYRAEFQQVFGSPGIDIDRITDAIAEFEKTLVTPNSRFDRWLLGDTKAITARELAGYELFKSSGCTACHSGPAVGANSYHKLGLVRPYKTENAARGRIAVTGNKADEFVFKVPTLRNIELTYPYFHDGEVATLREAVALMGQLQLGRDFTADEVDKITAFLKTLTGDQPTFPLPLLPPSTEQTPQPEPFG
ncbi:cytochrome-c peroxidase [Exilibacterium tricleocarpae]|uniref:Cytochrome-c peroxidase n=1 Tax=Exilibacterium tricleocarpae TaxID=2591008 RepID=A0A545TAE8_9GAMM|nr:cytochrome-c peroxidase [Exilibacterium tricleocarpae]TQV74193.1 cytochrome-c peroxidase [Exilibacterium tricleocarpae]